jgi:multiple sugar transport system substrate-binding protein
MKKNLLFKMLSIFVLASFILAACGSPAPTEAPAVNEEPAMTEAPAVTEAPATEASSDEVSVSAGAPAPTIRKKSTSTATSARNWMLELDGITLTYEPGGTEGANYQDQLRSEVAAGTAPDVFWIPGTDIADFATRGLILNASPTWLPRPMASMWMTSILARCTT